MDESSVDDGDFDNGDTYSSMEDNNKGMWLSSIRGCGVMVIRN